MRSTQVYRALEHVQNRFTLCQTISQSARRIHVNGNPFEGTVTVAFNGVGSGKFRSKIEGRLPTPEPGKDLLFHPIELL